MFCSGKTFYVEPNLCLHEIKHGGGRSSDSSAQVLRNSRLEFRLLPPSQHYALRISTPAAVGTLCSSDIISWPVGADVRRANCEAPERADADSAGNHVNAGDHIRNVMLFRYRLVAGRTRLK